MYDWNLFKFDPCIMAQNMSVLVNVPCALKKNVYSVMIVVLHKCLIDSIVQVYYIYPC